MRTGLPVQSNHGPAIGQDFGMMSSQIDHRFDRKDVTGPNFGTLSRFTVIWYLRIFVHAASDTMTHILTHNRVAAGLGMLLHRSSNVSQVPPGATLLNRKL
jgi:hypothetical protein